jgi:hypothetical protein
MGATADTILATLRIVDGERHRRGSDTALASKVAGLKAFQQQRFSHTYADLLHTARYGAAARFFLDELYGPEDFSRRDTQFARVVPSMVRLFPREIVETVATLAELHALSETLDTAMATHLDGTRIDAVAYVRAWQATAREADRAHQISLTVNVARQLDRLTGKPLLRNSLRLMRGPARAAGLAELQRFLEAGFDTFRAMKGADEFVEIVQFRERIFASTLFGANTVDTSAGVAARDVLACLPSDVTDNSRALRA